MSFEASDEQNIIPNKIKIPNNQNDTMSVKIKPPDQEIKFSFNGHKAFFKLG